MEPARPLRIGITCYPSVGGSGILASSLGVDLARRGHDVHFISYERPFRLPPDVPRVHFHPVGISSYGLFKYPDYTLPLSVKMAEVSRDHRLDVLHVHYAVPHATAAVLARSMLPPELRPKVVTTLHGTDTTLLGRDPGYGPAIRHALECSDAVTVVSEYLRDETRRLLGFDRPIDVVHNYFEPRPPRRTRDEVRHQLGVTDERDRAAQLELTPGEADRPAAGGRRAGAPARVVPPGDSRWRGLRAVRRRRPPTRPRGSGGRARARSRHRRLPAGGRPGAVYVRFRELLPEHPRGDVLRLPERRDARRRHPRGRGGRRLGSPRRPRRRRRARPGRRDLDRRPGTLHCPGRGRPTPRSERFSADVIVPRYEALYRRVCNTE